MYLALHNGKLISAADATNLRGEYSCPIEGCTASLILKSVDGHRNPYFASRHLDDHDLKCPYRYGYGRLHDVGQIEKYSLLDIVDGGQLRDAENLLGTVQPHKSPVAEKAAYVHTPKQLLNYCLSNSYDTQYIEGLRIRDFYVDSKTAVSMGYKQGFTGLKLVYGKMRRLDYREKALELYVGYKGGFIPMTAYLSPRVYSKVKKYFQDTFEMQIKGEPVAILGVWSLEKKDEGSSPRVQVEKNRNLIFHF